MLIDHIKKDIISRAFSVVSIRQFTFVTFLLLYLVACSTVQAGSLLKVINVIDGDTVVLKNGLTVRLLGINTPEMGYKGRAIEAGAVAAKKALKKWVLNKMVLVEYDVEQKDRYGRILAHLFLDDGQHINLEMLRSGQATLSIHPPNLRYAHRFKAMQRQAEKKKIGLWSLQAYQKKAVEDIAKNRAQGWGRFSGQVQKITRGKKGAKLWLSDEVYIWISVENKRYFLTLDSYKGKQLEVRGWPRKRGQLWSINVIHSSQILIET
ncbi:MULTISPECIES: thermonuclease family protein [Cycloclasticus]|jgi:micrococcal nuclease|uniref:Nuclease n=1 Tax=Cycloclasticus pugetii TaxID=34068 RepID=A0AB33Z2H7_9GAMM|nr:MULTISPECIES: thermonuclease family protein [Cycloclasticus]ATI02739.1 nuclease [Cycloclasticus sp. PY97N]EPD13483.1 nuclease [Cycloclasticus pugetii]